MKPNILLITTDQQRHDTLGIYGNPNIRTPYLNTLGQKGLVFENHYSSCPVCIPARRSLLTGLSPFEHGLNTYQDGVDFTPNHTVPQLLEQQGYHTALIGKFHMFPQRKRFGFSHMVLSDTPNYRKEFEYQNKNDYSNWLQKSPFVHDVNIGTLSSNGREARPFLLEETHHHSQWVVEEALNFLENKRDPSAPWFMHLSFVAPHPPLNPPQHFWNLYENLNMSANIGNWARALEGNFEFPELDATVGPFPEDDMKRARQGYYGLISHIDSLLASFDNRLFSTGSSFAKEPTYILFTTDHGEQLGDHHLWRKSMPYEGSTHIPLIISGRNIPIVPGRCQTLSCLEDVASTIIDLSGTDVPTQYGKSLAPCLKNKEFQVRDSVIGEYGAPLNYFYYVKNKVKYIRFTETGEEQLFDLASDPYELNDISGTSNQLSHYRHDLLNELEARGTTIKSVKNEPLNNRLPTLIKNKKK